MTWHLVLVLVLARVVVAVRRVIGGFLTVFITFILNVFGRLARLLVVAALHLMMGVLLVVRVVARLVEHVLVVLGRVGVGVVSVGALLNDEVSARVLDDLLPFCTNFLILNLWGTLLNSLHKTVFLAAMGQLESLLDDKIAIVVAYEGEEARRFTDLTDEDRPSLPVSRLQALLNDARGVLLNAQLRDLVCQFVENRLTNFWLPLLNNRADSIVAVRI